MRNPAAGPDTQNSTEQDTERTEAVPHFPCPNRGGTAPKKGIIP